LKLLEYLLASLGMKQINASIPCALGIGLLALGTNVLPLT
jgi:hypothetical protein